VKAFGVERQLIDEDLLGEPYDVISGRQEQKALPKQLPGIVTSILNETEEHYEWHLCNKPEPGPPEHAISP
jgi:hypothetical protein